MQITARNLTKDIDKTLLMPMSESKLVEILGKDEWIIVDSPIGDEFTSIHRLNLLLQNMDEETVFILSKGFYIEDIFEMAENQNFVIINFNDETANYNAGNGVVDDEWWKGYVLHDLGYENFPFKYQPEMEDYVKFEQLWYTAESEGWISVNYNSNTYLLKRI